MVNVHLTLTFDKVIIIYENACFCEYSLSWE